METRYRTMFVCGEGGWRSGNPALWTTKLMRTNSLFFSVQLVNKWGSFSVLTFSQNISHNSNQERRQETEA